MSVTEYPEVDIETHRWTAKLLKIFSVFLFFLSGALLSLDEAWRTDPASMGAVGLALAAIVYAVSISTNLQALQWGVNDIHHAESDSIDGGNSG